MKYCSLGKTGLKVSRLGFGCMRLPMTPAGKVYREKAIPLLQHGVELGVNYFDTAIFYCHGDSQRVLGEAFEKMRKRVILSTKNHMHESPADTWWARLEESLKFLRTDYIDVYNMHGMTWTTWTKHIDVPNGKLRLLEKARDQGLIRHIACSFHDSAKSLVKLAETGAIASITFQYNLLDRSLHDAIFRLKELGVGAVAMGPVGGGRLGMDSQQIRALTGDDVQTTAEAALRFVLAHPGVSVALSGMGTMEMLAENVRTVSDKEPFTPKQISRFNAEIKRIRKKMGVLCPACEYCQPCPFGVQISSNFAIFNDYRIYGLTDHYRQKYQSLTGKAVRCLECGKCISRCPQKINIPTILRQVTAELDTQFREFGVILTPAETNTDPLRYRLTAKNLSAKPLAITARMALDNGVTRKPSVSDFGKVGRGDTPHRMVTFKVPAGAGALSGKLEVHAGTETRTASFDIPFFLIPRDRLRWHNARITAANFAGRKDIVKTHGYRVGLRHDSRHVYIQLDIRSRLHAPAKPGESGGGRIEMYVDMRPPKEGFGTAPYTEGAEQFFVSLVETGYGSQSGRKYHLSQRNRKTRDGVVVTLQLPFAEFLKRGWPKPRHIGLDFMFVVCDSDGTELGYPTYGGKSGLYQNPGGFTRAFLLG
jgi:predicted aldo/keto reductase-like oxidoreductase